MLLVRATALGVGPVMEFSRILCTLLHASDGSVYDIYYYQCRFHVKYMDSYFGDTFFMKHFSFGILVSITITINPNSNHLCEYSTYNLIIFECLKSDRMPKKKKNETKNAVCYSINTFSCCCY